jgi:hypothetical protein
VATRTEGLVTGERLGELAAQWNRRWLGGALAAAAAAGTTAGVAAARIGGLGPAMGAGVGAIAGLIVLGAAFLRRTRLDAKLVARHLDRTLPEAEESAELTLADETRLSPLERLQRHRVLERLERVPEPGLPHRPLRRALRVAAALLAAAATIALWPAAGRSTGPSGGPATARRDGPPHITAVAVGITPPSYTGRRPRRARDWDLDGVEAGARITWRIDVSGPVTAGALVTTAGDSVSLRPAGAGRLSAALAPDGPRLYQVTVVGPGGRAVMGYHRLVVVPDAAPVVTVVRPDVRTTLHPATRPA